MRPDWTFRAVAPYTGGMPASKSDAKLLLGATAAVVAAGVIVAVVLLFATGRGASPKKYQPFSAGYAKNIKQELKDGGPYFFPDPFSGDKSILFALENGQIVALANVLPGTTGCTVRWRGSIDRFVDCHGDKLTSDQLDRYETTIDDAGQGKGLLFVNLKRKDAAPTPLG
jgi:hypothetical protein